MTQRLINLAFPVVSERIDQRLAAHPALPLHQASTGFDLRQKLEAYVLSRLPSRYVTLEDGQAGGFDAATHGYSSQQIQHIDELVEQGILRMVNRWSQATSAHTSAQEWSAPSSWFG